MRILQWEHFDERERARVGDRAEMYVRQVISGYGEGTLLRGPLIPYIDDYGHVNGYRESDFIVYTQGTVFCIEVKYYCTGGQLSLIRGEKPEMFAWLIRLTRHPESIPGLDPSLLDLRLPPDVLWPTPHSNIFNFEATQAGAEWIDEIALSSKGIIAMGVGELVIGHVEWSIKHIRYVGERVRVIYDWDSLTLDREPVLVGHSAVGFTYTEFFPVAWFPTSEEARAFVTEYEARVVNPSV